jgi:hypothetical protein
MITLTATDTLVINKENRNFEIMNFGEDNLYPNNTRTISENSSAVKRCLQIFEKFVFGKGVTENDDFFKRKINPAGLRVDQFLRRLVQEYTKHNGFAVHIGYNGILEKTFVQVFPFETLRLPKPDDEGNVTTVKYHPDWSQRRIEKKDIEVYHLYTTDKDVILRQIEQSGGFDKFKGHIMYFGADGVVQYPHNSFHSVIEEAVTDIKLKKGRNANASTNFMPSHMVQFPFMFKDQTPYEHDHDGSVFKKEIMESLANFQGFENQSKLMAIENPLRDKDGKTVPLQIDKLDIQNYDKLTELTEKTVKDNIRGVFNIPAILLEVVATGFSTEIMEDMYSYYNHITADDRLIMEETLSEVFRGWKTDINPSGNFAITPLTFKL